MKLLGFVKILVNNSGYRGEGSASWQVVGRSSARQNALEISRNIVKLELSLSYLNRLLDVLP